jgi:hypothetical protein
MADERQLPPLAYANVVQMTIGPYDLVMDFGFRTPEQLLQQSEEYVPVVRVAMSIAHAKTMLPILANLIAQYERQAGIIPAPGFDQLSRE